MLVGVMTLVASSVWAQTTIYERGEDTAWSDADLSAWNASQSEGITATIADNSFLITVPAGNSGGKTGEFTANIGTTNKQSLLTYTIKWNPGNATGKNDSSNGYVKFGDVEFHYYGQNKVARATIGGTTTDIGSWNRNTAVTLTVTVDQATGNVNYTWGGTKGTGVSHKAGEFTTFTVGYGGTVPNWENQVRLSSLIVTETEQTVETANYKVTYVDEDNNEIKDAETRTGVIGNSVTLLASDKEDFVTTDGETKYVYVSDNSADVIIADDNSAIVVVQFRKAAVYSYSLLDNFGNTIATGSGFEGETVDVAYPRYALVDGVFYEAPKTNDSKKQYRINIVLDKENATNTITYSEKEGNTVFYTEAEDLEGVTETTTGNLPIRASNGKGAVTENEVLITTLPAGKYILHLGVFTSKTSYSDLSVNIGVGETEFNAPFSSVNLNEVASSEYTLSEETNIIFLGVTGDAQFDYIWIEKTGDVEVTTKTIGLNPNIWDVEDATERYAAYVWKGEGAAKVEKWIDFAEVDGALAATIPDYYTGLILVRLNGETTENNWDNKWNQTDDIDFTAIADGTVFTITGWGEDGANSTYTTEEVVVDDLTALKEQLAKAIELGSAFGADTSAGEALLADPDATREQLTAALLAIIDAAKPKAEEVLTMAKAFFAKFDNVAGAALAPYFAAAEEALNGTDYDALYNSAMALFAQGLIEGQSAMTKVTSYLEKMENETINNDLAAFTAAVGKKNLKEIVDALRQLKNDLPNAAQTYALQVQAMVDEAIGDVSGIKTALNNVLTVYLQYQLGKASLVDVGYALYELIKAVEEYKESLNAPAYYLVGTMTNWAEDGVKEEYKLTLNEAADEGIEEYMITLDFAAGDEFKIVKNGETLVWYPSAENYTVTEAGSYTVYFRPNGDGGSDWFYNVIYALNNTTTGLRFVSTDTQNAVIYNLAGQKVMKAQKGLYIVNGKKVLVK